MNKMGLEVISFTIKEVRDKNEYITNMGRPDVARIKRDADVAAAEADRDTAIKRAVAAREASVAKAQADQETVLAQTLSMAKQAEATRDLEVKKAQYQEVTKRQQAQADKAYDIQTNIMQQQVIAPVGRSRWLNLIYPSALFLFLRPSGVENDAITRLKRSFQPHPHALTV